MIVKYNRNSIKKKEKKERSVNGSDSKRKKKKRTTTTHFKPLISFPSSHRGKDVKPCTHCRGHWNMEVTVKLEHASQRTYAERKKKQK